MLPANNEDESPYAECADDLNRICADLGRNCSRLRDFVLAKIADQQYFLELKEDYAKDMVTGFPSFEWSDGGSGCKPFCYL